MMPLKLIPTSARVSLKKSFNSAARYTAWSHHSSNNE
jgi:hypothetical protein